MADIQLSPKAQKLLKHFQDKQLRQRDFEYPATQQAVFGNPEDCEAAQTELAKVGILELMPVAPHAGSRVVGAALTLDGIRYLAKNPLA